jgi:hypothetical protein
MPIPTIPHDSNVSTQASVQVSTSEQVAIRDGLDTDGNQLFEVNIITTNTLYKGTVEYFSAQISDLEVKKYNDLKALDDKKTAIDAQKITVAEQYDAEIAVLQTIVDGGV